MIATWGSCAHEKPTVSEHGFQLTHRPHAGAAVR